LSVAGTSGDDTPTITGSHVAFAAAVTNFANLEHLAVFGGDGNDVFSIPSLGAAQSASPDLVSSLTELTLSGGNGNDTFSLVPLDGIAVTVDGGPQPSGGGDELTLNAEGLYAAADQGHIDVDGHQPMQYSGIEVINIINHAFRLFLSFLSR
jgi:microcystin-dependent protein